jgi:tetratricopeptide (TPR) repeat protein
MTCTCVRTTEKKQYLAAHRIVALFFSIVGFVIYANTFDAPTHYDDYRVFVTRDFSNFLQKNAFSSTRFVADLTFAFNKWLSGPEVFSYHLVNLLIHVFSAFLVYQLLFQILSFAKSRNSPNWFHSNEVSKFGLPPVTDFQFWAGFFGGLIFLIHPLSTQTVTYITQRYTSLATLFYLVSIVAYLRARDLTLHWESEERMVAAKHPFLKLRHLIWYSLAIVTAVLAMYTKEMSLTLPLMLVLIEFFFVQPNLEDVGKRTLYLLPLLATGLIIPYYHLPLLNSPSTPSVEPSILPSWGQDYLTRRTYLLSQLGVIWNIYLRLLVFPYGQSIEHDFFVSDRLLNPITLGAFIGLLSLVLFALATLRKYPLVAFGFVWFFVTISVTSSIIPNVIFVAEHRTYLPMVGLAFLAAGIYKYARSPRLFWSVAIPIALVFSTLTSMRNFAWNDDLTLWGEALKKAPDLDRPYNLSAMALHKAGRLDEAISMYKKVISMPRDPFKRTEVDKLFASHNLPSVYVDKHMYEDAHRSFRELIDLYGDHTEIGYFSLATVYFNLGGLYAKEKKYEKALDAYQRGLEIIPYEDKRLMSYGLTNIGWVLSLLERYGKAEIALKEAIHHNPRAAKAYLQLGILYSRYSFKRAETIECYTRYLALEPNPPFRQELLLRINALEREPNGEMNSNTLSEDHYDLKRLTPLSLNDPELVDLENCYPP